MNKELLEDLEKRTDLILQDNKDYNKIFETLRNDLLSSYISNDFRVSTLKNFASKLLAIISLVES